MIAAARAMMWGAYYADKMMGRESMNADTNMKQQMLCAHELCVREAKERKTRKNAKSRIEERLKPKTEGDKGAREGSDD